MKKSNLLMALLISVGISFASCGSSENKEAATQPEAVVAINTTNAYVCPMNCENSASDAPGKCVVCGMDLVSNPNYAGATTAVADSGTVTTDSVAATTSGEESHDDHSGHNH